MNRQPLLTGETLTLRPLTADDRDALFLVAGDPLIWEQHPADRHERAVFDAFFDDALASGGALVAQTHDGVVIGSSRYGDLDPDDSSIEVGWTFLARDFWGGPTNREMKQLMLDHAFTAVDRVYLYVAPENHRSQRAVEKLGAHRLTDSPRPGRVAFMIDRSAWVSTAAITRAASDAGPRG